MLEAFFGTGHPQPTLRQIELAWQGGWYVLAILDSHCDAVWCYRIIRDFHIATSSPAYTIVVGTAEDGGPLTKAEALAAKALLER